MNRTRSIFYLALAVVLLVLAGSLAEHVLNNSTLLQIYVTTTVFGVGVVLLDFTGLLGHHGDASGDTGGDIGHAGADAGGHDFGGHDLGGHAGGHADAGGDGHAGGAHDASLHDAGHVGHGEHADDHSNPQGAFGSGSRAAAGQSAAPVLSVLTYLRLLVYFCLGFGPAGWIGLAGGLGALGSLALGVPVGVGSLFLARAFFRFQRKDTGAVAPEAELMGEHATVVVPLDHTTMGKVRVQAGLEVTDLYAVAADEGAKFEHGADVRIVRVTDECVQVR